jgi:transposase
MAWKAWLVQGCGLSEQGQWIVERHLRRMRQLTEDIKAVESRLASLTQDDGLVTDLLALPGIGWVTAWTIRAEIGRFDRFASGKQLSRFCGLSPRNASSGSRQADSGLIQAGNRQLRATLIEAAHRLIRHDRRWGALATALLEAGKPKCVVVAAVANRWVRWLYHQMQPPRLAA